MKIQREEAEMRRKVKKFNMHNVNQLFDNSSKMLFGSLRSIFTIPTPERGVLEGSEECAIAVEQLTQLNTNITNNNSDKSISNDKNNNSDICKSPVLPVKPFISKSLDAVNRKEQQTGKKFIHNVDEQLRRNNITLKNSDSYADSDQIAQNLVFTENNKENLLTENLSLPPSDIVQLQHTPKLLQRQEEITENELRMLNHEKDSVNNSIDELTNTMTMSSKLVTRDSCSQVFRNKFIINCESTVYEHTGISYSYDNEAFDTNILNEFQDSGKLYSHCEEGKDSKNFGIEHRPDNYRKMFMPAPLAKTFSNLLRSFKDSNYKSKTNTTSAMDNNNKNTSNNHNTNVNPKVNNNEG